MTLQQIPKVELHLHLDCGLSFEVVSRIDPSVTKVQWLTEFVAPAKCASLADFLTRAVKGYQLMQTREQLELMVADLFNQLSATNTIYAEIRFAPLQHLEQGLTPYEVVAFTEEALSSCVTKTGIEARLILCTLRHYTRDQSMETVKLAEHFKNTKVAGIDIAADEAGFPVDNHIAAFEYARQNGIPSTAHAGEARGAESVWETLQYFGPARLGHGVRSIEDPKLVEHLRKHNIHLEICPSCNIQVNLYDQYRDHPIDRLYRAGLSLSVNTDAPTIVGISLTDEYERLRQVFGWTLGDLYQCNVYALEAAFIPRELKNKLLDKLKAGYNL